MTLFSQFTTTHLKQHSNPNVYITAMEDMHTKLSEMDTKMEDHTFIIQVLNWLPQYYEHEVGYLTHKLDDKSNPTDINEIRCELFLQYIQLKKYSKNCQECINAN